VSDLYLVTILSGFEINNFAGQPAKSVCYNLVGMCCNFQGGWLVT
jgi:hypothetical protein